MITVHAIFDGPEGPDLTPARLAAPIEAQDDDARELFGRLGDVLERAEGAG